MHINPKIIVIIIACIMIWCGAYAVQTSTTPNLAESAETLEPTISESVPPVINTQESIEPSVPASSDIEQTEPTPETTAPEQTEPTHTHDYTVTIIQPDCINSGYSVYSCICGYSYTSDEINPLNHDWKKWVESESATWFKSGQEVRSCSRCHVSESRTTPKKTIKETGTITIPEKKDVLSYIIAPEEKDFGKYYENAVKLYNAFLNQQEEELGLFFSEKTYELELQAWREFKKKFEEICFQGCGVSIWKDSFTTGAFPEGAGLTRIDLHVNKTQALYEACYDAIAAMGLKTGMSQYEAVLIMNEWIRQNFTYELEHYEPLHCLETKKAQCAGYAYVFEYLCHYVGVNSLYVTGCVGHEDGHCQYSCHAWNRVQLAGDWYYLDICWNDAKTPNRYFLTKELWKGRNVRNESNVA